MINRKQLLIAVLILTAITFASFTLGSTEISSLFYEPLLAVIIVGVCTED
jgi:hypothetical protein